MGNLRVGYFGYRGWAFKLLDRLKRRHDFSLIATVPYREEKINYKRYKNLKTFDPKDKTAVPRLIKKAKLDVALFYGWSWIVTDEVTQKIDCLCLHPSLLPQYRGGCPLQHQILNNEKNSGLSIFRMNNILDGGDILAQRKFSLNGRLQDIFDRIVKTGAEATLDILKAYEEKRVIYTLQRNLDQFPAYKRRKPEESELKPDQLKTLSSQYFYNFIRALDTPYPNAYITLADGSRLLLQEVKIAKKKPVRGLLFNGTSESVKKNTYLKLKNGYAKLVRYTVVNNLA